jgi:V-type H+-transporting ATPase subunit C
MLQKEITGLDNDVKTKYNQYNQVKTNLSNLQKRQTGNLSNKSLTAIVPPKLIIQDSEYLETHLVAVPSQQVREFPKTYETVSPWVVPRSAMKVAEDDEFTLFAVTTFKKYSSEFVHKAREQKWIPRDYKFKEGGREAEKMEVDKVAKEERKLWGEALRIGRASWGDAVMAWIHVLALQVFVETVLRYGLPLSFVCGLVKVCIVSREYIGYSNICDRRLQN